MTPRRARRPRRHLSTTAAATATVVLTALLAAPLAGTATAAPSTTTAPKAAPTLPASIVSTATVGGLEVENSFVSSVGWVKPGARYPSRILVTNTGTAPVSGATVAITAPPGSSIVQAGTTTVGASSYTWQVPTVDPGSTATLVLESRAASTDEVSTIVWRDLSTRAVATVGGASQTVTSHGPKVIPPGDEFDTARYGDRPFPVVPVAYSDRGYQPHDRTLDTVINDPDYPGSTFNLYQEMSLGQLYPDGTVPSADIDTADFDYAPGFDFTKNDPASTTTCGGTTYETVQPDEKANPLYTERVRNGVYQLPGTTGYYGSDANGSALVGALGGVGALQAIDSGCGPVGKLVHDAAAIADPDIDYSDYDTDKDGVVDFFMAVFAGCGGNGASQLTVAGCAYPDAPYDNVWPHSSSLEFYYSDPRTGLPGFTTDDQLKDLEGRPLWYTDDTYSEKTTTPGPDALKVLVRVGPYNVNPETAIDHASVISHEYGHSLGLPDFYSTGGRETYGDWSLMATDKSHNIDSYGRQELGWVVPQVLDSSRTVTGMSDSKEDINTITWQRPDGTAYTLTEGRDGVGRVQNSEMYVAKLPGRVLLDPAKFESGDKATPVHTWWSRSGNDYGCAKDVGKGHNIDLAVPEVADLPAGTRLSLDLKSMWDIEWDYDYGYVLTSLDGGRTFTSNDSEKGFTTSNTDPLAGNPNANACQQHYDNGLTGTSGSYAAGSPAVDRKAGEYPEMVYLADNYDITELVGAASPVLRFSYATDPGLSRPGWFIDDVKVTATLPDGSTRTIYATDFESSGSPEDQRIFNGGCRADGPGGNCTQGWQYVAAGEEGPSDHAYYLELRDRSGFDVDGKGQNDRADIAFLPGLYNAYTDEAHGYGNAGTDDPPAQSPLDSQPEPGNDAPDLADAAWTAAAGDNRFSDSGAGHTDNYTDPDGADEQWHFRHDCLTYDVLSMAGQGIGPDVSDGDLTGSVAFTMGAGCAEFDYGYGAEQLPDPGSASPVAAATATPSRAKVSELVTFDGTGTTDADTPARELDHSWDFDDGGDTKDASGVRVAHVFQRAGTYDAILTVTDPQGHTDTATTTVTVTGSGTSSRTEVVECQTRKVDRDGSWRVVRGRGPGDTYCDNRGRGAGKDTLRMRFRGGELTVLHGRARRGGVAVVRVDGERVGAVKFRGSSRRPRFTTRRAFTDLGRGRHQVVLTMRRGQGYVDGFRVRR